jgi:hypothetical protein
MSGIIKWTNWLAIGGIGAAAAAGCSASPAEESTNFGDLTFSGSDEAVRLPASGQVLNAITQPGVVSPLESRGFSINALMSKGLKSTPATKINLEALYNETAWYKIIAEGVGQDVSKRRTELGAVYGAPQTKQPRAFDYGYLRSPESVYELLAVVNRIDRKDLDATPTCGELRFVYRMKYKKAGNSGAFSRLPFALNLIFSAKDDGAGCLTYAKRWKVPAGIDTSQKYIDWVVAQAGRTCRRIAIRQRPTRFLAVAPSTFYASTKPTEPR